MKLRRNENGGSKALIEFHTLKERVKLGAKRSRGRPPTTGEYIVRAKAIQEAIDRE